MTKYRFLIMCILTLLINQIAFAELKKEDRDAFLRAIKGRHTPKVLDMLSGPSGQDLAKIMEEKQPQSIRLPDNFKAIIVNKPKIETSVLFHGIYNLDITKALVAKGIDVNIKDWRGRTPLYCVYNRNIAEFLIANGALVNIKNDSGSTPLHDARDKAVIEVLISKGADVNAQDNGAQTPLFYWARGSNVDIASLLIEHGADVNIKNKQGDNVLHSTNNPAIMQLFVSKGADVKCKNKSGTTPLHNAISADVAEILLDNGADVNAEAQGGVTPLLRAASRGPALVKTLIEHGANVNWDAGQNGSPIKFAVRSNYIEAVDLLLSHGVKVNCADKSESNTPLHWAVSKEMVEHLISKGAKVNAVNKIGYTPLHMAADQNVSVTIGLIAAGADVKALTDNAETPLFLAAGATNRTVLEYLLKKGAQINTLNGKSNISPLTNAILSMRSFDSEIKAYEAVRFMISKGAILDPPGSQSTPLYAAVDGGRVQIAKLLIDNGAKTDATGPTGKTLIEIATEKKNAPMVELLRPNGAK